MDWKSYEQQDTQDLPQKRGGKQNKITSSQKSQVSHSPQLPTTPLIRPIQLVPCRWDEAGGMKQVGCLSSLSASSVGQTAQQLNWKSPLIPLPPDSEDMGTKWERTCKVVKGPQSRNRRTPTHLSLPGVHSPQGPPALITVQRHTHYQVLSHQGHLQASAEITVQERFFQALRRPLKKGSLLFSLLPLSLFSLPLSKFLLRAQGWL